MSLCNKRTSARDLYQDTTSFDNLIYQWSLHLFTLTRHMTSGIAVLTTPGPGLYLKSATAAHDLSCHTISSTSSNIELQMLDTRLTHGLTSNEQYSLTLFQRSRHDMHSFTNILLFLGPILDRLSSELPFTIYIPQKQRTRDIPKQRISFHNYSLTHTPTSAILFLFKAQHEDSERLIRIEREVGDGGCRPTRNGNKSRNAHQVMKNKRKQTRKEPRISRVVHEMVHSLNNHDISWTHHEVRWCLP